MNMKKTLLILCAFLALTASSCDKQNTASQEQEAAKGEYVLSFTSDTLRYLGVGESLSFEVKVAAAPSEDKTISLYVPANTSEYCRAYNYKYAAVAQPLAKSMYTLGTAELKAGQTEVVLKLDIDQSAVHAAVSEKPFLIPLSVQSTDGTMKSHDTRYVLVPSYSVSEEGKTRVHTAGASSFLEISYPYSGNTKALIFCPGGGYSSLGTKDVETWEGQGITMALLNYTLPINELIGRHDLVIQDAGDAVDIMRANASRWGGYSQVGTVGRSAGGHLAGLTANLFKDKVDYQILLYPVISMDIARSHEGSVLHFLGYNRSQADVDAYSLEKIVTADTPRAFVAYSYDDAVVPQKYNGPVYVKALQDAGVEVHDDPHDTGGHTTVNWSNFPSDMHAWLKTF